MLNQTGKSFVVFGEMWYTKFIYKQLVYKHQYSAEGFHNQLSTRVT